MLSLYYGDDAIKRRAAIDRAIAAAKSRAVFFVALGEPFESLIEENKESISLFGEISAVILDGALANKDARGWILERIAALAQSPNLFIFSEAKQPVKEALAAFQKAGANMQEFPGAKKAAAMPEANVFALTDAFARKDKKESWVLLAKAYRANKSPEEIAGLLFWQLKNLMLVKDPRATAQSLGMKPFVFSKASAAAKAWTSDELASLSAKLIRAVHGSRRGETDAQSALERLVLEAF